MQYFDASKGVGLGKLATDVGMTCTSASGYKSVGVA